MSTDNQQLEIKISNMEKELAEMKKILATPEPVSTYWTPKKYEDYWYVNNSLQVQTLTNSDNLGDRYRTFKTKAEASRYADYIKAEETLKKAIADLNQGWWPDFNNGKQDKFFIYSQIADHKLYIDRWLYHKEQPAFMYMESRDIAESIIAKYQAELLTYFSY